MDELGDRWTKLAPNATIPTVFVCHAWQRTWADLYIANASTPRTLFILAVWMEGRLIGIAPWYITYRRAWGLGVREVRPIGYPETAADHLDILADAGREEMVAAAVERALWGELRASWDLLSLHEVPAGSMVLSHFVRILEERGVHVDVRMGGYCPRILLPAETTRIVSDLSAGTRRDFRRNFRAVSGAGAVNHISLSGSEILPKLQMFLQLHAARWPRHDVRLYGFVDMLIRSSAIEVGARLDYLTIDGEMCAALLHFTRGRRMEQFLVGGDRERHPRINTGKALLGMCLERAVEEGVSEYDFLKGAEPYKFDWANGGYRSLVVRITRRRPGPLVLWGVGRAKDLGRILRR